MTLPADGTTTVGDRYVLEEVIGRGGMAEVYRATDSVLDRQVAVKVLREVTDDPSDRARFVAEAKTLAKLNHAGLVTVLDAGTTSDRPYLVMALIEGPNLAECCSGTALHLSRVIAVGSQVADALAHAHASGVVHRDVKPSNIMLGRDGRVWLTDFGIARLIGDTAQHTRTGTTIGSPAYLAPEQVRGREVTPAADIYSLGLVLLEMITGRRVYPQTSTEAALARLTTPPEVPDDLPSGWAAILHRMTAMEPEERPTAAEVGRDLRRLSDGEDATTVTAALAAEVDSTRVMTRTAAAPPPRTIASPPPPPSRPTSPARAPAWGKAVAAAALAVVALIVALVVLPGLVGGDDFPDGVPAELEPPLRDLHDAVHGEDS